MPIKPAAIKALRQNQQRRIRNQKVNHRLKKLSVQLRKSITAKDRAKAEDFTKQLIKQLDRAAQRGVIHRNTAARKKSRLLAALKKFNG